MNSKVPILFVIASFVFISLTGSSLKSSSTGVVNARAYADKGIADFAGLCRQLHMAVQAIDKSKASVTNARQQLSMCRANYKKIEFFTSYFFPSETRFYNAAPKFEVEEPTLELVEPMGLQQIEALLFEDDVQANKEVLLAQTDAMLTSAEDMDALLYGFEASDAQILESVRIQLIRMSVLGISGYDAPLLKSGIAETAAVTKALQHVLQPYFHKEMVQSQKLNKLFSSSLVYLEAHAGFDSFNRMEYLVNFALPMQEQLGRFISQLGLELNTTRFLNYNAAHIYSKDALKAFDSLTGNQNLALLGKALFFDKSLSGNLAVSCASCHQPQNYFTDQLAKSPAINPDSTLKRNTPTLLYAGWQHSQFWDGKAESLEKQIHTVMFNPLEMNGADSLLNKNVLQNSRYTHLLSASFPNKKPAEMEAGQVSSALAAYIRTLNPMDSPFDRYLTGDKSAMSEKQIKGFNLFMGKAQCGSCHFPPFFNSLLPPFFDISEVEVLGLTKTDNLRKPQADTDRGRFELYNIRYYNGAFKTPTVRNAAKTAPYMHNGAYNSLASVIEFYNLGGGKGLGLNIPDQTLSAKPLNLTQTESQQLIAFIESLTDSAKQISNYQN